jgi:hypothetical protein
MKNMTFCLKTRHIATAAFAGAVLLWSARAEIYTWDSANPVTSFGDDAVTLELDGSSISKMTKNMANDVMFVGDSMSFTAGAEVPLTGGKLIYALPLSAAGAITFGSDSGLSIYDGQPLSGVSNIVAFTGKNISEMVPCWCDYNKNHWPGCNLTIEGRGAPYHVVVGDNVLDVQFQAFTGGYVKCVKVRFAQEGANVVARILYAKYISGTSNLGADFDTLAGVHSFPIAIDHMGTQGYGTDYIVMRPRGEAIPTVEVTDSFSAAGTVTNAIGAALVFSGDSALSASGATPCDFHVCNSLVFKNRRYGRFELSGNVTGDMSSELSFPPWDVAVPFVAGDSLSVTGVLEDSGYKYIGTSWMSSGKDVLVSAVTNVTGLVAGRAVAENPSPHVCFVSNSVDGLTRFYQFQTYAAPWFKTMDVELSYINNALCVRVARAQYCSWDQVPGTGDEKFGYVLTLDDAKAKGGNSYSVGGYAIHHVDVHYEDFDAKFTSTSVLTGGNSVDYGVINVEGRNGIPTCLVVSNAAALPPKGSLNVYSGGIVEFRAEGLDLYAGYQNGSCLMNVFEGGTLRQACGSAFGANSQRVNAKGGKVVLGYGMNTGKDSHTYLQYLDMSDGAVLEGVCYPRIGYMRACKWTSSGTVTNQVNCGLMLVGGNESGAERPFPLVCDGPIAFNGEIISYSDVWGGKLTNCVIEKTGPSKAIQYGSNFMAAPLRLFEGSWVLGASGLVNDTKRFELRGGALELADGVEQDLLALPLLTNGVSGVVLGEGSLLSIAEGGLTFAEGARLAVTGPEVSDMHRTGLRVGTTACLPAETLSKIKYNDFAVRQDSEGYILAASHGTMILFK